jgi:hypothetical protein
VRAHYILPGKTSSNSHCANFLLNEKKTEMEFFDNALTKDSSVLLHAIHRFYSKIRAEKSAKQENLSLFMYNILYKEKKDRKKTRV